MPTLSANLTNALDPAKIEIFLDGFLSEDFAFAEWMAIQPGRTRTIEKSSIHPPSAYGTRVEGNDYPTTSLREGTSPTYTMVERVIGFETSEFADRFLDVTAKAQFVADVAISARRRMEFDATAVLTDGFTVNGPDGVPLFSDAHVLPAAADQDNLGTTALDYAAVVAAALLGERHRSPDNLISGVRYDTLLVPPDLRGQATQLVGNLTVNALTGITNTRDNVNVVGQWINQVMVVKDFADTNDWILMDRARAIRKFNMYLNKGPMPTQYTDTESGNWRLKDSMVYAVGHDNAWRTVFGARVA